MDYTVERSAYDEGIDPPKTPRKVWCFGCLSALFLVLALMSSLAYVLTNFLISYSLMDELVVSSQNSTRYLDWACKFAYGSWGGCEKPHFAVPFYESYYMYNLTNYDDTLAGSPPEFSLHGPYTYRVNITKFDISFAANGSSVDYREAHMYLWDQEKSCTGCAPEDEFLAINAGYLGALNTTGSEAVLLLGLTGPTINRMVEDIERTYVADQINTRGYSEVMDRCRVIDLNCHTPFHAALLQWGYYSKSPNAIGLFGDSVTGMYDEFPDKAEYGAFSIDNSAPAAVLRFNLKTMELMLYGPHGIVTDPLNLLEMAKAFESNPDLLLERWGLTSVQFTAFLKYFMSITPTYNTRLYTSVTGLRQGGGLFSQRSVHQWVFDFSDPLLEYLQPGDTQTNVRQNDTSISVASFYKGVTRIETGLSDRHQIANVVFWNGTSSVDFWQEPIQVNGNNQDGQFFWQLPNGLGRFPSRLQPYPVWSPDHAREITLLDTGIRVKASYNDIPLVRYALSNATYDVDPFFHQDVLGFVNVGSFHLDPPFRIRHVFGSSVPLYMSQPLMWLANSTYVEKVKVANMHPSFDTCATIVDVEPLTGNTMNVAKRLQVNYYLDESTARDRFHIGLQKDIFLPTMYIEQTAGVTKELADDWSSQIGLIDALRGYVFVIGQSICYSGLILFACLTVFYLRRHKHSLRYGDYETIN